MAIVIYRKGIKQSLSAINCTDQIAEYRHDEEMQEAPDATETEIRCHQRRIRDEMMEKYPRPVMTSLDGFTVAFVLGRKFTTAVDKFVREYEYLGTTPKVRKGLRVALLFGNEIAGVALFGHGPGNRAQLVCGPEYAMNTVCYERGACAPWAHPHAGSFLISRACQQMYRMSRYQEHRQMIFYAYADPDAREIGTIYQACNWYYIGQGAYFNDGKLTYRKFNKKYLPPKDNPCGQPHRSLTERNEREKRNKHCGHTITEHKTMGWQEEPVPTKHRYVWFAGSKTEKNKLKKALRYPVLPYPKRSN